MGEVALRGVSAAPGITTGKAVVLDRRRLRDEARIPDAERAREAERARDALQHVAADLQRIAAGLRDGGRPEEAEIVETGVLMALDPDLGSRVDRLVIELGVPGASALETATEETADQLARLPDPTLAQRADDIRSVGRRAAARVGGAAETSADAILVAGTLGPADVAELAPQVRGIALVAGGVTAHAAIVARSLGLPMVVGAGARLLEIADGEEVIVDGDRGVVVLHPDPEHVTAAQTDAARRRLARDAAIARRLEPAETTDGRRVRVLANASTLAELEEADSQGAEGVGLMRTELLFLESAAWPSRAQQAAVLRPVLARLSGRTATVRLFDFGGDKTPPFLRGVSARGIEVLLGSPDRLKAHLDALVEAGRGAQLRLLIPMVMSRADVTAVRTVLARVVDGGDMPLVGAMIETPEAAAAAREIAAECDFLSIGTNDLTQLVLGLDRERSRRAPVLDRRVLTLIAQSVRGGHEAGIPVDVCGEAASDEDALPVMVGFGADELSVAAARVGQVKQWVRELSYASSRDRAQKLLHQPGHASGQRV